MLRKIRILFAIIFFTGITLLFLDFTGTMHRWLGWLAKIQLIPAILALNIGVILFLLLLTLLFGRIYCSVICPLGIFQDGVSWFSRKRKKHKYSWSPAKKWLRVSALAFFIIALFVGISAIVSILDPYSAYGRIASNLFLPLYQWGNNLFAYFAERVDSYAFYSIDVWMKSIPTFIIAVVTFITLIVLAWRNGRTYCNTICPVGTVLGFVARFSIFKPRLNAEKCTNCGLCERSCRASCINIKEHEIDYSRCVSCMDCLTACKKNGIHYQPQLPWKKSTENHQQKEVTEEKPDSSRRSFLTIAAAFAVTSTAKAQRNRVDGGLALIEDKKVPTRQTPIKPPGSQGLNHFSRHCTACQLCVSACPNHILTPSNKITTLMQPEMTFEKGYCRSNCTKCSEVCPTGAIHRIDTAEKSAIQVGRAVWVSENCIVNRDSVSCRSCERHCPVGAIILVPKIPGDATSLKIPAIDTERCIGCGACEYYCPARPFAAIYVEGNERHRMV